MDIALPRATEGLLELPSELKCSAGIGCAVHSQEVANRIRYERLVARRNQSVGVDKGSHRAGCVRASAESEQENPIAFLVIVHQEHVCIPNICLQAVSKRKPQKARPKSFPDG